MKKAVDPIKELKRELAALTKQVASLEKQLAKQAERDDITCTSLKVVDAQGKTVASIDGKGLLSSRSAWVAPGPNTRGIWLDGDNGRVQCLRFVLQNRTSNTELIEMSSAFGSPLVELRGDKENNGVRLQVYKGQGGIIDVTSTTVGGGGVQISASKNGSDVRVKKAGVPLGGVTLRSSYLEGGDGVVYTQDRNGNLTAWIPPRADGTPPEILTEKEIAKGSGRKSAK